MRKSEIITLGISFLYLVSAVLLYPHLPEILASHWNVRGEVDLYIPKFWVLFFMPPVALLVFVCFFISPRIDPLKENIEKFRKQFDLFMIATSVFLFAVYLATILWNLKVRFNMNQFLAPALSFIFYFAGLLTEKTKRNWFIGIKTPWTLSSDAVWEKTNKLGGKMFKAYAVFVLIGILFPSLLIFFFIVPVVFLYSYIVAYSYIEYKKEVKG